MFWTGVLERIVQECLGSLFPVQFSARPPCLGKGQVLVRARVASSLLVTPEDAAFLSELMAAGERIPGYSFVGTMAEMEKSDADWSGETGFITGAMLRKHINDLSLPIYYIVGPPAMVRAMREMLNETGVNEDNIRTEEFSGY